MNTNTDTNEIKDITIKKTRVEDRIVQNFGVDVKTFLLDCQHNQIDTHRIADMLECSVSNLRRIIRKYALPQFQPINREPLLSDCEMFQSPTVNIYNWLSRPWIAQ